MFLHEYLIVGTMFSPLYGIMFLVVRAWLSDLKGDE